MANGNPITAQRYTLKITSEWGSAGEFVLVVNPQGGENLGMISSGGTKENRDLIKLALGVLEEHWGRPSPLNAGFAFDKNGTQIANIWATPDDRGLVGGTVEPKERGDVGIEADERGSELREDDEALPDLMRGPETIYPGYYECQVTRAVVNPSNPGDRTQAMLRLDKPIPVDTGRMILSLRTGGRMEMGVLSVFTDPDADKPVGSGDLSAYIIATSRKADPINLKGLMDASVRIYLDHFPIQ
jgi:hypothetical protein